jgi:hypothetical protein
MAMKIASQTMQDTNKTGLLLENVMKNAKYGTAEMRFGTILLKPGCIHWTVIFNSEMHDFIIQQPEVNLSSDCKVKVKGRAIA